LTKEHYVYVRFEQYAGNLGSTTERNYGPYESAQLDTNILVVTEYDGKPEDLAYYDGAWYLVENDDLYEKVTIYPGNPG
jgi:hypothetical protein